MGFASLHEDVVNRLLGELDAFSRRVEQLPPETHPRLEAIRTKWRELHKDLTASMELATSPEVNVAQRLQDAERENTHLREKLAALEGIDSKYTKLVEENLRVVSRAGKHSSRLIECENECQKLKKALEKAVRRR